MVNFEEEVLQQSKELPVVVDFWAPWCGPCQVLGPVIEKLANEANGNWTLVKVNVDDNQDLAGQYNVRGIPAVKMFINGEVAAEFSGALPEQQIKAWLEQHIPDEADKELDQVAQTIEAGNTAQAKKMLRSFLEQNPEHPRASFMLGKILLAKNPKEALTLFGQAEKKADFVAETLPLKRLAEILQYRNNPSELEEAPVKEEFLSALQNVYDNKIGVAIEKLINTIIKNKAYQNEAAREACIGIFVMLGAQHETTKKYRKRFDMALY